MTLSQKSAMCDSLAAHMMRSLVGASKRAREAVEKIRPLLVPASSEVNHREWIEYGYDMCVDCGVPSPRTASVERGRDSSQMMQ